MKEATQITFTAKFAVTFIYKTLSLDLVPRSHAPVLYQKKSSSIEKTPRCFFKRP